MDVPCAIMIAVFCLPQSNLKLEVKDDEAGSTALVSFSNVRTSIVLPTDESDPPRGELSQQLCVERSYCIPYAARVRDDVSSVELLIEGSDGREHFIQFKGPLEQIAALSGRFLLAYDFNGRRTLVPLSDFTVARGPTEPSEAPQEASPGPEPSVGDNQSPNERPEALPDDRTTVLPDEPFPAPTTDVPPELAPVPEVSEQPWPRP